jgi:phosphoglycolate phosphatase
MTDNSNHLRNIFFDLDGTLVDTKLGVFRCYQYALSKLGQPYPGDDTMLQFLGPPLRYAFTTLLKTKDNAVIENAVSIYRERYTTTGIYECAPYPGIMELLAELHKHNLRLFVVTTKAKPYADTIAQYLGFSKWLTDVYGPGMNGDMDDKAKMIRHILSSRSLNSQETVMIGDRDRDIQAGKTNHTRTMGITYGYGSTVEIAMAKPDYICHSPAGIRNEFRHGSQ